LYVAAQHPEIAAVLTYAPALQTTPATMQIAAAIMAPFIPYRARGAEPPTAADPRWQGYPELPTRAAVQLFRLQRRMPRLLPAVRQPLLIVQGRKDKTVFPDSPARIAQLVSSPVKEVHWMERSTHCVLLDEEWEQAASITIKFLERVL
jgi:carboxylesterase